MSETKETKKPKIISLKEYQEKIKKQEEEELLKRVLDLNKYLPDD